MKSYLLFIILLLFPAVIYALDFPKTNSKIVEIYDATDNKIVYEVDSTKKNFYCIINKNSYYYNCN